METTLIYQATKDVVCDALIIGVTMPEMGGENRTITLSALTQEVDQALDGLISEMYTRNEIKGSIGEVTQIYTMGKLAARSVIVAGLGSVNKLQAHTFRRASGIATRFAQKRGASQIVLALGERSATELQAAVEGALLGAYSFTKYLTLQKSKQRIERIQFLSKEAENHTWQEALKRGIVMADGANFARDLVNEQPAILTPSELARRANAMTGNTDLECTILEPAQMKALGMGGLLAVGRGSAEEQRLVILRYRGAPEKQEQEIALVGKGVTFDAGGLSIKSAAGMQDMKGDMGGGAAVLGAMRIIATLKPHINVLALVPATENMVDGAAYHPGDILRLMNGKTIEIVNTDAEGRLILADALSYAVKEGCSPIIDIATLTGGAHIALGGKRAALFCNDDRLSQELLAAGASTGEKFWALPLDEEYQELIESHIADIKQTGGKYGSAISAAKILEHFVGQASWAHLDIAGLEFVEEKQPFMEKGATGMGARVLAELVLRQAEH